MNLIRSAYNLDSRYGCISAIICRKGYRRVGVWEFTLQRPLAAQGHCAARLPPGLSIDPSAADSGAGQAGGCPEIDCVRALLASNVIDDAERRAAALGVGADRVLITAGQLSEDAYLRALAAAVVAPTSTMLTFEMMLAVVFLAWGLRLAGVFVERLVSDSSPGLPDDTLTVYTVIAALYREAASVDGLLRAIYLTSAFLGWLGLLRRGLLSTARILLLPPLHWLLLSLAAWRALYQLVFAPYAWEKTEHGLAKSSRLNARMTRSLIDLERYLSALKESSDLPTLIPDVQRAPPLGSRIPASPPAIDISLTAGSATDSAADRPPFPPACDRA